MNGSSVLRSTSKGDRECLEEQRQVYPMADSDCFQGWKDTGLNTVGRRRL